MPIKPQTRRLDPIQARVSQPPIDQIIAVRGRSPLGTGILAASELLSNAMRQRAELRRKAQQAEALATAFGEDPSLYNQMGPELSTEAIRQKVELAKIRPDMPKITKPVRLYTVDKVGGVLDTLTGEPLSYFDPQYDWKPANVSEEQALGIRGQNLEARLAGMRQKHIGEFNSNPEVKQAETTRSMAGNVRQLIDVPNALANPISDKAVQTIITRIFEKGALTEADKRPYGGSQALAKRVEQAYQTWKAGTLTPENRAFLLDLVGKLEMRAAENILRIGNIKASQNAKFKALYSGRDDAYEYLIPGEYRSQLQALSGRSQVVAPDEKADYVYNPTTGKLEVAK